MSPAFSSTAIDARGVTATSYPLASLANNTLYHWRVRGVNQGGTGPWSGVRIFTTAPATAGTVRDTTQILRNNDFESGTQEWTFQTSGDGSFVTETPGFSGSAAARLSITTAADNIQLYQQEISLEPNAVYRLKFSGYSSSGQDLAIGLMQQTPPFTNYGLQARVVPLSTAWRTYTIYLQTMNFSGTVNDARLQFWFPGFAGGGDQYWLDALYMQQANPPPLPGPPEFIIPPAAATKQPEEVTIQWTGSEGADGYRVQLASDASLNTL